MTNKSDRCCIKNAVLNSTKIIQWYKDDALMLGVEVGRVTERAVGFHYEVTLNSIKLAAGERLRRRDAMRQVELFWRRLLAGPLNLDCPDRAFVERARFLIKIENGSAVAITADRIIDALAAKHGVTVQRIARGYTAWRLSRSRQARDFRWTVVRDMPVLDLLQNVEEALGELRRVS